MVAPSTPASIARGRRAALYARGARRYARLLERLERLSARVALARFITFTLAAGLAFAAWSDGVWVYGALSALSALGFAVAVYLHRAPYAYVPRVKARLELHEAAAARLFGEGADDGAAFLQVNRPELSELQIFGRYSLWSRLNRAQLPQGRARLAHLLSHGQEADALPERQAAAEELSRLTVWRHHFEGHARRVDLDEAGLAALLGWMEQPTLPYLKHLIWTGRALLAASWISALLALLLDYATPWRGLFAAQILLFGLTTRRFSLDYMPLLGRDGAQPLLALRGLFALIERRRFDSPLLARLREALGRPSEEMRALEGALNGLAARASALTWGVINVLGLWELFQYGRLARWREAEGARLRAHLVRLADVEALAAIGGYRFDHPHTTWPTIDPEGPLFDAQGVGHPLFDPGTRRGNDLALIPGKLGIVTGSNMSGKSSLLRAVGINTRMALAGLPVCAEALTLQPCALSTSIQVTDAPGEGLSRFYAEVKRIKRILDEVKAAEAEGEARPRIFLIDEMLSGTNSRERHIASEAIARQLLEARRSSGLITTHDLELVRLEGVDPERVTLGHFSDRFDGEALHFDYTLKAGVARTTNALLVLKLEGIEVPASSAE